MRIVVRLVDMSLLSRSGVTQAEFLIIGSGCRTRRAPLVLQPEVGS